MAAMAPALTDPAPDAHNLHFKLAPPSSSLPLGETNGGCLPPPAPPDLVTSYGGTPGKETLKLGGVYAPRSILSQSLCRGRSSILEFNLEDLRGITNSNRGGQGGPLNGLAKRPAKPAVDRPPSLTIPALEPWVKAPPVPPGSPAEENEQKGSRVEHDSDARLKALLRRHGEMEKRARSIQKRLQVVQAKQVERHLHQQLGGLVGTAFGRNSERSRLTVVTRKADAQRRGESGIAISEAFLKEASPELERLSCSGTATLRTCERGFDSDATESSSGGDSDVEEEELGRVDTQQNHVPLKRRCEWTWAQERADVVSRWNWLQAHVSDLEYRIRQHTDFYRQLRAGKGQVLLGDASSSESCVGDTLHLSPDGRAAVSASQSPDPERKAEPGTTDHKLLPKPINGVVMLPQRASADMDEQVSSKPVTTLPDSSCVCARTRPVLHCKRRRVVRPERILPLHRKVQSSVPRPCEISSSCVMCATFPGLSTHFPYSDPLSERLTLLDPAIHPVLSFPADVPAGLRLHALLRSHNKIGRLKSSKKLKQRPSNSVPSTPEVSRTDRMPGIFHTHKLTLHRPLPELPPKQHLESLQRTLKCERSSAPRPERSLPLSLTQNKKRHFSPLERDGRHELDTAGPSLVTDNNPSPSHASLSRQLSTPSDSSLSAAAAAARRRRSETSYDIDNIVIPMSVAATTRVERLQYKEILTPSWRVVKITPVTPSSEADIDELEDLSDAAYTALHAKCEESERARWICSSILPQRRGSRTHRTSEGSMTTQPLTPQPPSPDTGSWQAVPDFSPLSPDVLSAPPTPTSRDTPRLISEETQSSVSDSGYEEMIVQPWERRNFPLSYNPKPEIAGTSEPPDWGGPRPSRRASCSSRTAKDTEGPPSSPPCPSTRPRPLHR